MVEDTKIVHLDVGGTKYTTSLETLLKYSNSMLGLMFSGRIPSNRDKEGCYFIDADGDMFVYILNFLRRNQLCLPEAFQEYDRLLSEAEFFQIDVLVETIREMKSKRDTVLLCMITPGVHSGIGSKVCIAHFQLHNSFRTNHIPMDHAVYKNFLLSQGYSVLERGERIEYTGEWLLSMMTQGFLKDPHKTYEKNFLERIDSYEIWGR